MTSDGIERRETRQRLKRLDDVKKQITLVEGQREKHRDRIGLAAEREENLYAWIAEREVSIREMHAELLRLPAQVVQSRSVIARLDLDLQKLRARGESIKMKDRKKKQLQAVREELAKLEREAD